MTDTTDKPLWMRMKEEGGFILDEAPNQAKMIIKYADEVLALETRIAELEQQLSIFDADAIRKLTDRMQGEIESLRADNSREIE